MKYRFEIRGKNLDGLALEMDRMGFDRIKEKDSQISAELYKPVDGCTDCMNERVLGPVAEQIKKSEYGGGIETMSYKPTLVSRALYEFMVLLFVKTRPKYWHYSREFNKIFDKVKAENQV